MPDTETTPRNRLAIFVGGRGAIGITLSNPGMTMAGWIFDRATGTLNHRAKGAPTLRFTPEKAAEIAAAIDACTPHVVSALTGAEVAALPEAERAGYAFSHVKGDAVGIYVKETPGVGKSVLFGKADLVGWEG